MDVPSTPTSLRGSGSDLRAGANESPSTVPGTKDRASSQEDRGWKSHWTVILW